MRSMVCNKTITRVVILYVNILSYFSLFSSVRSSRNANLCSSVRSFGSKLSRAFNLHHSGSGIFQVSLRSFLGLSLSLSFSKISDLTYSDRRSLKYCVLFIFIPVAGGDPETRPPVAAIRDPGPGRAVRVSR